MRACAHRYALYVKTCELALENCEGTTILAYDTTPR